jgi:hypothetical protein
LGRAKEAAMEKEKEWPFEVQEQVLGNHLLIVFLKQKIIQFVKLSQKVETTMINITIK